ncbi:MAG TPA: metallophosphoesterase family protein [Thermomicrobiales bacterium]|jgi:predicted phosphodiesterase
MKIGLIADIHGNLLALDAVLAALAPERLDRLICLGDVAALGPRPVETLTRLRDLACPVILGNTDAWLLATPPDDPNAGSSPPVAALTRWCRDRLSVADLEYLGTFPPTLTMPLDGGHTLLCCHGSPRSYDDVIAATTPDDALDACLDGHRPTILVGGHTHIQLVRRHGQMPIINVGSVGLPGVGPGTSDLPVNRGVTWAEYGILDVTGDRLGIDLRRLPLDLPRMLADARASGMPEYDWWRGLWGG